MWSWSWFVLLTNFPFTAQWHKSKMFFFLSIISGDLFDFEYLEHSIRERKLLLTKRPSVLARYKCENKCWFTFSNDRLRYLLYFEKKIAKLCFFTSYNLMRYTLVSCRSSSSSLRQCLIIFRVLFNTKTIKGTIFMISSLP